MAVPIFLATQFTHKNVHKNSADMGIQLSNLCELLDSEIILWTHRNTIVEFIPAVSNEGDI